MTDLAPTDRIKRSLLQFLPDRWAEWASDGRFVPYDYQRLIARRVASSVAKGNGRLIVNLPSRHGKSELCSHWLPTWFLDSYPDRGVILSSYGAELAERWGREVRNEFDDNPRMISRLREDSTAANRWNTPEGGGMVAVGVGGPVVGFGGNLVIIDDPHKNEDEANSPLYRDKVQRWFQATLYSRIEPGGTVVLLMQRWHPEDLSGWLIEHHPDPWEVIRLPALAEENDPMGRAPGDALCPERYDVDDLHRIRAAMGPTAWAAMFQQRPEGHGTGRLYHQFTQADNLDKTLTLRPELPLHVSFDFNRNPGMHVELGQYDPAADLFTAVHEIHGPYMKLAPSLDAMGKLVDSLGGFQWPVLEVFGDATGTQERAETTLTCYQTITQWLDRKGWPYRFRVPRANPPVRDRLETFNVALHDAAGEVHYKVHPVNCPRLVADLKDMKEDEQGLEDKRDQKLSHASSAEGYRVHWLRPLAKPPKRAAVYGGSALSST